MRKRYESPIAAMPPERYRQAEYSATGQNKEHKII